MNKDESPISEKLSDNDTPSIPQQLTEQEIEKNKLINDNELSEREWWSKDEKTLQYLYPNLNDPRFNIKIAEKKEFNDTKYDGKINPINEEAEKLCNAEFELSPHQQFVKNFLSFQTPYNSLLLYHGLGSGKTCSAIGVAEEMRDYIKQLGVNQRIIVVASPNVQENFKLQLFDETKLQLVDGIWIIRSCTGNKLIREINPLNMQGLSREKVINQIKHLINISYLFMGYTEFANYIEKKSDVGTALVKNKEAVIKERLRQNFNNRLIIIDEVHNMRITDDSKGKRIAKELLKLVTNVDNIRLLFLSATPLYNSYKEIVWLINIMNVNDGRSMIEVKDVFDNNGDFKVNETGEEVGKQLLERKATGYISFVRGDNPYTFPYRIWPSEFNPSKTLAERVYPQLQINGKSIVQPIQHLSLYIIDLEAYQTSGYNYIVNKLDNDPESILNSPSNIDTLGSLGYIQLQKPIEALNMVYPNDDLFEEGMDASIETKDLVGKGGLMHTMTYKETMSPPSKTNFEYKKEILETYGRFFSPANIGTYSGKIKEICNSIINSEGVILIYSLYLDGGLVPIALALEEMGITRYGSVPSLFKTPPVENLDLKTFTNSRARGTISAKYIMITGDKKLSPNNVADLRAATQKDNTNGDTVKIILISQAGSEGLDFKFIRQVHILEPWYNLSRIEQIIGRAVRHCSHKDLPFEKRNVEIFLYGSQLTDEQEEAADLYVYRLAETKAIHIGEVTRVLKEISVDCLLNSEQLNFSKENINQIIKQKLSNGSIIDYSVGDKPYTAQCDYMDTCLYKCKPVNEIGEINELSYSEPFIEMNTERIIYRIKQLMKERYFYEKKDLISQINVIRKYPLVQIYTALSQLINDKNEHIADKYGRLGSLVNIGDYYFFQPLELNDEHISIYERSVPIPFKRDAIPFPVDDKLNKSEATSLTLAKPLQEAEVSIADGANKASTSYDLDESISKEKSDSSLVIAKPSISPSIESAKTILAEMSANYNKAKENQTIIRGDTDWYNHSSIVLKQLDKQGHPSEVLDELLVSHLIESLLFNDLLNVLNYIYSKTTLTSLETKIKNYFDYNLLTNKKITGLLVHAWDPSSPAKPIQRLLILTPTENKWKLAEAEDYIDLAPIIEEKVIPRNKLNDILGFMANFKDRVMIFKVKENKPGNMGARCDQAGKTTAARLNSIVGTNKYQESGLTKTPALQLCVLQEFLLRLNDYNRKDDKKWFLTPVEAIITNTKIVTKKK